MTRDDAPRAPREEADATASLDDALRAQLELLWQVELGETAMAVEFDPLARP